MSAFNLLMLRHGKSDWRVDTSDYSRPLKPRGELAARRIGQWLYRSGELPDYILCSPALRARQTANIACEAMAIAQSAIRTSADAYHATPQVIVSLIHPLSERYRRVLYVGHNPGMEEAVLNWLRHQPPPHKDGKTLPTGTLAHLVFKHSESLVRAGEAELKHMIRGKELKP